MKVIFRKTSTLLKAHQVLYTPVGYLIVNNRGHNTLSFENHKNYFFSGHSTILGLITFSLQRHGLDVHESVHRDTTIKITNKMHYID
jgi:hypothetical protein